MLIDDLACHGFSIGRTLTQTERDSIVDVALRFEECNDSREALMDMSDRDLVETAFRAMSDYAQGQL